MSNAVLNISSGPHARDRWTTRFIMLMVAAALLPATIVGIAVNGVHAGLIVLLSVVSAVGTEFVFDTLCHKPKTYLDGSALVTGLLLALSLSPSTPLYAPVIGAIFAILVAKLCFGGLGKNFINPALAGRCFLLISFGKDMTNFEIDGVSTATPIAVLAEGHAVDITKMFLGTGGGVIGASILALLVGGLVLWAMDIIHGQIWISVIVGFTVFMGLFGGQGFDPYFLLAHLCGGGVVMGAFFMATDYTTSPVSRLGQTVYGVMIGVLGALFRIYGSAADSFSYSMIIANLFTPLIETYIVPKPFAYRKAAIAAQNGEEKVPLLKRIPKPVITLAVITLLAGVALSGVYSATKDIIAKQKRAEAAASYKAVLPQAEAFVYSDALDELIADMGGEIYSNGYGKSYIREAVIGTNSSGEIVGYVVSVTNGDGYKGDITLSVGISLDDSVSGISFTEISETPGLGMKATEPEFMNQFSGKNVESFVLLKSGAAAENEIDGLSGATFTSRAVVNGVNAGLSFYHNVLKGGTWIE